VHAHAFNHGADALKIWIPATAPGIVRMTDHVAERWSLAANLAFHCHDDSSPILTMLSKESSLAEFWPIRTGFDSLVNGTVADHANSHMSETSTFCGPPNSVPF
jgi:hypothetical protein